MNLENIVQTYFFCNLRILFALSYPFLLGAQESPMAQAVPVADTEKPEIVRPTSRTVLVGATLPLYREGKIIKRGINAAFRSINQAGGVNGRYLRLRSLDDQKQKQKAIENIKFLRKATPFLLTPFSVGVVEDSRSFAQEKGLFILGPDENTSSLYSAQYPHVYHTKPSMAQELDALVRYIVHDLKKEKIAIFYVSNSYGKQGLDDARVVLNRYGVKPVIEVSYISPSINIHPAVKEIAKVHPEVVICLSRRHATYNFIVECINKGLVRTEFLGTSYLLPVQKLLKKARGINLMTTSVVPNPLQSTLPIVKDYRRDFKRYYPHDVLSVMSLAGYINAAIFGELARTVDGRPTLENMVKATEKLDKYKFKGLILDFNAETRTILSNLWISTGYGKKWIEVSVPSVKREQE